MPLPQEIKPLNSELMDTLVEASKMDWIPQDNDPKRAFMKILWTGSESGTWAVLFRWLKGYVAPEHKHLSASHTFILSGKLQVRDGTLNAGDYVYEPNGMLHGATTALEDTEYLFICNGPVLFYNKNGFTQYLGWEELERIRQQHAGKKKAAKAKAAPKAKAATRAKAAPKARAKKAA
ncbi:MAG: cupin domain-containing protein [Gammaproteobacteria bacterium]|nr:cupin domain-containing protein [Gammaproteobacteria bacterium]